MEYKELTQKEEFEAKTLLLLWFLGFIGVMTAPFWVVAIGGSFAIGMLVLGVGFIFWMFVLALIVV